MKKMLKKMVTSMTIALLGFATFAVAQNSDYTSGWLPTGHPEVEYRWKRHNWGPLDPSCDVDIAYRGGRANISYTIRYEVPRTGERRYMGKDYGVTSERYGGNNFFSCSNVYDVEVRSVEPR